MTDDHTRTVTTPLGDLAHDAALAAGVRPDTARVVDAGVRDGELRLDIAGEPLGGEG